MFDQVRREILFIWEVIILWVQLIQSLRFVEVLGKLFLALFVCLNEVDLLPDHDLGVC
jgi:hypothetical protein